MTPIEASAMGASLPRTDGPGKVTGTAPYAFEQPVTDPLYLHAVQATIARGRVTGTDTATAEATDGVVAVLTHANAGGLASTEDREYAVLQSDEVAFRGQFIGGVIATTPETARHAASLVTVTYDVQPHDVELRAEGDDLYTPEVVNGNYPPDTDVGDVEAALAAAAVTLDATYSTPTEFNNPMEPHTTVAAWNDDVDQLTLYESTQGPHTVRQTVATVFGLEPERVTVIAPFVGGGFGSKGMPHAPAFLAALAARLVPGRAVKFALTRQQMFVVAGYRTPTIQHLRLGADADGRLTASEHAAVAQTSRIKEFGEQAAVITRSMYAGANRRTSHRLAALDVPVPSWMRAPGEAPGAYALEAAMDEMAIACGLDPVEFRIRNEPELDPETGKPFSSRNLVTCLREGARRFGWQDRDPTPGVRRDGDWLVGTGVAAATYPVLRIPGSHATIRCVGPERFRVRIAAVDIGTGTWTALAQIAADALGVPVEAVELEIGDTAQPAASVEGGSSGITSWGSTIVDAARTFRDKFGDDPDEDDEADGSMPDNPDTGRYSMSAYGAYFVEARVHALTGEVRVPRMLGVFAAGRIVNPRLARSQLLGGMVMGQSMALYEVGVMDPRFGQVANHDFAEYHVAANADVRDIEATWIDEEDPYVNPMGTKGIGEIGIVGSAAAVTNALYHATGIRVRDLPVTPDKLLRP